MAHPRPSYRLAHTLITGLVFACLLLAGCSPQSAETSAGGTSSSVSATAAGASSDTPVYYNHEMLVVFESPGAASEASRQIALMSIDDADTLAAAASDNAATSVSAAEQSSQPVLVTLKDDVSVEKAVEEANNTPGIVFAQPNYYYGLPAGEDQPGQTADDTSNPLSLLSTDSSSSTIPNDPFLQLLDYSSTTHNAWQLKQINAFTAWQYARCDSGRESSGGEGQQVTVAVLDTGCLSTHQDLQDNVLTNYAYNVVNKTQTATDINGHGTHVAGIIAATANNGVGTAGSSYNARIIPVRIFTDNTASSTSYLVAAYDYLLQLAQEHPELNLHVINMSIGAYNALGEEDYLLRQRIQQAQELNILTVAAGGNGNGSTTPYTKPCYPGDFPEVVGVTALSGDGSTPLVFSDYNENKTICAPGQKVFSTFNTSDTAYKALSGTSMATPLTSGSVALLWAYDPTMTTEQAVQLITKTASPITVAADREGLYGAGQLNIGAALATLWLKDKDLIRGDVNHSGTLTATDADLISDLAEGRYTSSGSETPYDLFPLPVGWDATTLLRVADYDADGAITTADAKAIRQALASAAV